MATTAATATRVRAAPRHRAGCHGAARRRSDAANDAAYDAGYSVVEAVITLPVVIVMTMLVVQYALLWHGRNVAEAAAQDGLRSARGYQATAVLGQQAALGYLQQVAPNLLTNPTVTADRNASTVTVRVQAHVLSILGFGSFTVTERAAGPVEKFVGP